MALHNRGQRERVRAVENGARHAAERCASVGGVAGAVMGARDGPVGAGLGALVGGSTAYAVGYLLSHRNGSADDSRKPTLDEYLGDGDDGPFGIDVESVDEDDDPEPGEA